jgi:hypothetical protein
MFGGNADIYCAVWNVECEPVKAAMANRKRITRKKPAKYPVAGLTPAVRARSSITTDTYPGGEAGTNNGTLMLLQTTPGPSTAATIHPLAG